jgi:predicted phage tail component-like protein
MNYNVIFNDSSTKDLGIKIVKEIDIPIPKRRVELTPLDGVDGSYSEDLETYDSIVIPVECNFIDREDINSKASRIAHWLTNINNEKLIFSDDTRYFRIVEKVECEDIKRQLRVKGSFIINFTCNPFKHLNEEALISITANSSIYSPELVYVSIPTIKVFGSGDITLTINGQDQLLYSVSGHIILNSDLEEAYNESFDNLNNNTNGEFLRLKNGKNDVSFIGTVSKIEITPNWCIL